MAGIKSSRVLKKQNQSYVAQHDIRAHLTRIFGFANWSTRVISLTCVNEEQKATNGNWLITYLAVVELTVCAEDGTPLATYQDANAEECAPQPSKGNAHALAATSAVSTALKRCAINLGDQFGLSLYEKGSTASIVKGSLVAPEGEVAEVHEVEVKDMGDEQIGVPERSLNEQKSGAEPEVVFDPPTDYTEAVERWMTDLRFHATNDVAESRILAVAALKAEAGRSFPAGFLEEQVEVAGRTMARGILADEVAGGKYLVKEKR